MGNGQMDNSPLPCRNESNRDEPGSTNVYRYGKLAFFMAISHVTVGIPHRSVRRPFIREALRVGGVRSDGSPNSSYKEYICYAHVSLCQRELRKHMS